MKLTGYKFIDSPGCGGWVVDVYGLIVWPEPREDGFIPIGTQADAERIAASIPGARAERVDGVLYLPEP